MLNLNMQIGICPLQKHIPTVCKSIGSYPYHLTIGCCGQIICWSPFPSLHPIFYLIPSLNGDNEKCISLILTPLRLIHQDKDDYQMKIVTYHGDRKIRIWSGMDGMCLRVSQEVIGEEAIVGLVENLFVGRFIFMFSNTLIFVFDTWTMKIVAKLNPKKEDYSNYLKGSINQKHQLEIYDNYHKSYRLDISCLFTQCLCDIGKYINNFKKSQKQLAVILSSIQSTPLIPIQKSWKNQDQKPVLNKIVSILSQYQSEHLYKKLFSQNILVEYPNLSEIFYQGVKVACQNVAFVKDMQLWYFLGMEDGTLFAFSATKRKDKQFFVFKDQTNCKKGCNNAVKYLSLIDNLLIASWHDGSLKSYSTDSICYMIQSYHSPPQPKLIILQLNATKVYTNKLSNYIKYRLPIYLINTSGSSQPIQTEKAFQLENNQVVVFDMIGFRMVYFVGVSQKVKIFAVLYINSIQYVGIATDQGIQVYGPDYYQRRIQYSNWEWQDFNIFNKNQHYPKLSILNQQSSGLDLIQHSSLSLSNKPAQPGNLLWQTFSNLSIQSLSNQLYPTYHFLDKPLILQSIHSKSTQQFLIILKYKHNNYRKDGVENTSFFLGLDLGDFLDRLAADHKDINQFVNDYYVAFAMFLWDQLKQDIPFLTNLLRNSNYQFTLKRRYIRQGAGKTFTLYFNTQESIFNLSKYVMTQYALCSLSLLQAHVMKKIQQTDSMVSAVQHFTLSGPQQKIQISGKFLSLFMGSKNSNILKSSINLLISSIISKSPCLNTTYQYFILNMKRLQQAKQKQLSTIQCGWMVYMTMGIVYGKDNVQKQQIKMLLTRIIDAIHIVNFVQQPHLVMVVMKLFNQGLHHWKELITNDIAIKFILNLFQIFFYYDGIGNIPADDKKFNFCFQHNTSQQIKRMKQSIIKTIVCISKQFNKEFIQCLSSQTTNQKGHAYYPSSVIQVLRQWLKSQKPTNQLVFFIQLLLQCLSPMTPSLRKYVQKATILTLQYMCTYPCISFNQTSQKLSICTANHIYIYCLRTSTKWRTISLKDKQITQDMILEMSPKGSYLGLLARRLYVWRLSTGFWSGVVGAFSQGYTFQANGKQILWDQNQISVTVVNKDPHLNQVFKL